MYKNYSTVVITRSTTVKNPTVNWNKIWNVDSTSATRKRYLVSPLSVRDSFLCRPHSSISHLVYNSFYPWTHVGRTCMRRWLIKKCIHYQGSGCLPNFWHGIPWIFYDFFLVFSDSPSKFYKLFSLNSSSQIKNFEGYRNFDTFSSICCS